MSGPRIRGVRARPLDLALERPVETSAGAMRTMPIVLIDVATDAGITGRSYIRCYTPAALEPLARLVANLEDLIAGEAAEPAGVETTLLHDMEKSIAARASDHVMLDVMRIGGVSGWLRGAALADAAGLPASSHTFPELSASLLAVTPTCHRLEWLDHAGPVLREPVRIVDGHLPVPERPGSGLEWDEERIVRL